MKQNLRECEFYKWIKPPTEKWRWEFLIKLSTENKERIVNWDSRNKQFSMLKKVVNYCKSDECRRKQILAYFGEDYSGNCRKCDVCLKVQT